MNTSTPCNNGVSKNVIFMGLLLASASSIISAFTATPHHISTSSSLQLKNNPHGNNDVVGLYQQYSPSKLMECKKKQSTRLKMNSSWPTSEKEKSTNDNSDVETAEAAGPIEVDSNGLYVLKNKEEHL